MGKILNKKIIVAEYITIFYIVRMNKTFHPLILQASLKKLSSKKTYFEGWYFKFVSSSDVNCAVIPGISLEGEDSHAFIQTISNANGHSSYTRFSLDEISWSDKPFFISIGANYFSEHKVVLGDRIPVEGTVNITDLHPYPIILGRPGIMGWFRYLPFMECYHAVISTHHSLQGQLTIANNKIDLSEGFGYMEKDWGTSFPSSYIWMQANSFKEKDTSFMLSIAMIPWFGHQFKGFLGYLNLGERLITFSTYTNAQLVITFIDEDSVVLEIMGKGSGKKNNLNKNESIEVKASHKAASKLVAPVSGSMKRVIRESIEASIEITYKLDKTIQYQEKSENTGLEIVGNREILKH